MQLSRFRVKMRMKSLMRHGVTSEREGCRRKDTAPFLDIKVTAIDAKSYGLQKSEKVLDHHAKENKTKYKEASHERRIYFTPLVYSDDGMACKEATAAVRRLASLLADKWNHRYSEMVGFVRTRMALAIVRGPTHCF